MENHMDIKRASCRKDFLEHAKPFAANMEKNRKMLHRTGYEKCYNSKFMYKYIDFDTLEESESFSPRLSKCQICFPEQ